MGHRQLPRFRIGAKHWSFPLALAYLLGVNVISSAGPPSTIGIYAVQDLVVSKLSGEKEEPETVLKFPSDAELNNVDEIPAGWERDGLGPNMAKIIDVGQNPKRKAFAIVDDSTSGPRRMA